MTQLQIRTEGHERHIFPCDCGDFHYVEVDWDDVDPDWRWLQLTEGLFAYPWKARIKAAWLILSGKHHHHSGVILDEANTKALLEVLQKHDLGK